MPTLGCPAKPSSRPGVKIRIRPLAASSTKTVSEKPSSAATVLAPLLRHLVAVEEDPERVAELPLGVAEDAQNVQLRH